MNRVDQAAAARAARMLPPAIGPEHRARYRQFQLILRTAGLAAAYAHATARSRDPGSTGETYARITDGIQRHLQERQLIPASPESLPHRDVLQYIAAMDTSSYAQASAETAALARWLTRLADAAYADEAAAPKDAP